MIRNCEKTVNINVNMCGHNCGGNSEENNVPCCNCTSPGILAITVGQGGDFLKLSEALSYIRNTVANVVNIKFVSNVVEDEDKTLSIGSVQGHVPINLNGCGYTLDLSAIKQDYGISVSAGAVATITDITILAKNVNLAPLASSNSAYLHIINNVKVIAGGTSKTQWGISAHHMGRIFINGTGNSFHNCAVGIRAHSNSNIIVIKEVEFVNVTNQYLPIKNTLSNNNSYIDLRY